MRIHYKPRPPDLLAMVDFSRKLPRRLEQAFDEVRYQLGMRAEDMAEWVLHQAQANNSLPIWIKDWWRTERNSEEDHSGIDFGFVTDVGRLNINIKSSDSGAERFVVDTRDKRVKVRPVVIDVRKPEKYHYISIIGVLGRWREEKLSLKLGERK